MRRDIPPGARQDETTDRLMGPAELAQAIIADCEGDARAAVLALIRINSALMMELEALTVARAHRQSRRGHH
ncbi:MAG: hypothetical protein JO068_07675 [Hyphomicrobiales bacterium]|nr:hypothetical protein [Hyphomicrobiales bacterium]